MYAVTRLKQYTERPGWPRTEVYNWGLQDMWNGMAISFFNDISHVKWRVRDLATGTHALPPPPAREHRPSLSQDGLLQQFHAKDSALCGLFRPTAHGVQVLTSTTR
jgi:hypothetical protein